MCSVAAGYESALALSTDGRVYAWGNGNGYHDGMVYHDGMDMEDEIVPLPTLVQALANETVSMVAVGGYNSCAVTEDGALFTWGSFADYGCLGHGDTEPQPTPRRVEALRGCRIATAALGAFHTLAAAEDGSVYGFGISSRLGFGTVSHESQLTPRRIPNLKVWLGGAADRGGSFAS